MNKPSDLLWAVYLDIESGEESLCCVALLTRSKALPPFDYLDQKMSVFQKAYAYLEAYRPAGSPIMYWWPKGDKQSRLDALKNAYNDAIVQGE